MNYNHQQGQTVVIGAGVTLTQPDLKAFRVRVELALSAADNVIVDLNKTKRVDSWALLVLSDLAARYAPRISFDAPDYLQQILTRLDPRSKG